MFDPAFENPGFTDYLNSLGVETRSISPRRHNKNVLESKHRTIRDVYLRLNAGVQPDSAHTERVLEQKAILISNDSHGTDVCSARDLARGYTRPAMEGVFSNKVPTEILAAHDELVAFRKLSCILRSKSVSEEKVCARDTVQVYVQKQFGKRGKWSSPKLCFHTIIFQELSLF